MSQSKLLIIDDEPSVIELITDTLSEFDYEIFGAFDGEKALSILKQVTPDLIIIDWEMPRKNGIETIREIKQIPTVKNIPIIMITGRMTSVDDLKVAFDVGVIDFIRKPFSPVELVARTRSMLLLSMYYKESVRQKDWELALLTRNNKKNEMLINDLIDSVDVSFKNTIHQYSFEYKDIIGKVKKLRYSLKNNSWDQFENYFKNVHPNFSENLMNAYPKITSEELKLCYFLRLNMNSKEIASITNKESSSIDIARYRLRKKLNLDKDDKLHEFLMRF